MAMLQESIAHTSGQRVFSALFRVLRLVFVCHVETRIMEQ